MASQRAKLDTYDVAILRELQRDSSLSVDDLAERVNLSRNACWRRVKILEENKVVRARVALVAPAAVNAGLSVIVRISTNQHSSEWAAQFRDAVMALPEIVGAYRTSGQIDYILMARVPDVAGYDQLYRKLIAKVDMMDVAATFVMEAIKETTEVPLCYV